MKYIFLLSVPIIFLACAGKQTTGTTKTTIDSIAVVATKPNDSIALVAPADESPAVTTEIKPEAAQPVTKASEKKKEKKSKTPDGVQKVIVDASHATPEAKGKTYRIKSFSIEGDVLSIDITYKGGCGQNTFELYSNGFLKKSLPPQVDVLLEHKKENETCSEEVKQTLKFDISPLKKSAYDLIVVNINSADNKLDWKIQ